MNSDDRLAREFTRRYGRSPIGIASAPGRVNLIGEHIDYHGAGVLPMALQLGVGVAWAPRPDGRIRATSGHATLSEVEFEVADARPASPGAGWINHLRAAARYVADRTGRSDFGADLHVVADVPVASGLSSSSALIIAVGLALLDRAGALPDLDVATRIGLAEDFARAERFVGTEGGGMDQAAVLCGVAGHVLRIDFAPLTVRPIALPGRLAVIVAHTGVVADKSGAALERYNAIRKAAETTEVRDHLRTEQKRVAQVAELLERGETEGLGPLLDASHASLNERLGVGHPALDRLVEVARTAGALGARMTGAGFGGSIVALAEATRSQRVVEALRSVQAAEFPGATPTFVAEAGAGASTRRLSTRGLGDA